MLKILFALMIVGAIFVFEIMLDGIVEKDRPRVIFCWITLVLIITGLLD